MSTSLLATKLHIPPLRPSLVPRPRLIERLDRVQRSGHRLGLISAPAGFGKTTLLSEWAQHGTPNRHQSKVDKNGSLKRAPCPALFLQGDAAFGGLEDEPAQRAADLLPRGQHIKIQGAGHNIHNTQPEAALRAAMQFFESL